MSASPERGCALVMGVLLVVFLPGACCMGQVGGSTFAVLAAVPLIGAIASAAVMLATGAFGEDEWELGNQRAAFALGMPQLLLVLPFTCWLLNSSGGAPSPLLLAVAGAAGLGVLAGSLATTYAVAKGIERRAAEQAHPADGGSGSMRRARGRR